MREVDGKQQIVNIAVVGVGLGQQTALLQVSHYVRPVGTVRGDLIRLATTWMLNVEVLHAAAQAVGAVGYVDCALQPLTFECVQCHTQACESETGVGGGDACNAHL